MSVSSLPLFLTTRTWHPLPPFTSTATPVLPSLIRPVPGLLRPLLTCNYLPHQPKSIYTRPLFFLTVSSCCLCCVFSCGQNETLDLIWTRTCLLRVCCLPPCVLAYLLVYLPLHVSSFMDNKILELYLIYLFCLCLGPIPNFLRNLLLQILSIWAFLWPYTWQSWLSHIITTQLIWYPWFYLLHQTKSHGTYSRINSNLMFTCFDPWGQLWLDSFEHSLVKWMQTMLLWKC